MQIVIDIDEDVFTRLFDNGTEDDEIMNDDLFAIANSIRNGTPLPKGHGKIIDEKDIFPLYHCTSGVYCDHKDCATCQFHSVAEYELDNVPTLIEEVNADV